MIDPTDPTTRRAFLNALGAGAVYGTARAPAPPRAQQSDAPVLSVRDFGARGDGRTDDVAALRRGLAAAHDLGRALYLPAGTYLVSETLEIPVDRAREAHLAIRGEFSPLTHTGGVRGGAVIRTTGDFTALRTRGTRGQGTSDSWSHFLDIADLYVQGPGTLGTGARESVGIDLDGVFMGRFHNLHAEGFGTGIRAQNGSEMWFTGVTYAQNNHTGVQVRRTSPESDLQAWFENLLTINNQLNLLCDSPRSLWVLSGENITLREYMRGLDQGLPRVRVRGGENSQLHFSHYNLENHFDVPAVEVDEAGVMLLTFDRCNFESSRVPTVVRCRGWWDHVAVRDCMLDRRILNAAAGTLVPPLLDLAAQGRNDRLKACAVTVSGNSPAVADAWVARAVPGPDPAGDVVPPGWVQVSPAPDADEALAEPGGAGGQAGLAPGGAYGFTAEGALLGKGRLFWRAGDANTLEVHFAQPLRGVRLLYLTVVLDDGAGEDAAGARASVPRVEHLGGIGNWNDNGPPFNPFASRLEAHRVGGRTFRRYGLTVAVQAAGAPIRFVRLGGLRGGGPATGVESVRVYAPAASAPAPSAERRLPAAPDDPRWADRPRGAFRAGEVVYNAAPAPGAPAGWICVRAGAPGAWAPFGQVG